MIEGLKPYAEYKDSGQEWLGGVPAHWSLQLGHAAFAPRKESNRGMKEKTVLSLSYGRIKVKATDKQHGLVPESYETYQVVNEGNVIIRGTDLQNDHTSLRIGLSRNRGIISSAYLCLESRPAVTPDYGYQILNVFDLTKAIYRYGSGLRQNLDHGEIKRLPIFLPPLDEQAAIVRFLDHANRKIDGFIRAKRKLIGLLNEQKQAIIHRAVTRGLNPDVKLKDSGIPWLGEIPRHWETIRCGGLFREVVDVGHANARLLSIDRFKGIIPQDEIGRRTRASYDRGAYKRVKPGQLAYNLMNAFMGALGFSQYDGIVSPAYAVAQPLQDIDTRYFHNLLRTSSYTGEFNRLSYGIMYERNRLYFERFKLVRALLPPLSEQKKIADWIEANTGSLTTAIARTEREIALMLEYRTRLTADIVTGKLDVREAAAKLPEETAEPSGEEALDEIEEVEAEEIEV